MPKPQLCESLEDYLTFYAKQNQESRTKAQSIDKKKHSVGVTPVSSTCYQVIAKSYNLATFRLYLADE